MEQFGRYFASVTVVYVVEDALLGGMYETFCSFCPKITKKTLSEALSSKEQLRSHLFVLELSKASKEQIETVIKKINSLETLLICDNSSSVELLKGAIYYKIGGVISKDVGNKEFLNVIKSLLLSISYKQKEKQRQESYAKLLEFGNMLFCIKKNGVFTYANSNLLRLAGGDSLAALLADKEQDNKLLEFLSSINQNDEDNLYVKLSQKESYLVDVKKYKNEQLIYCLKTEQNSVDFDGSLGHTEFIELLKNILLQRDVDGEPTFVVAVKLENSQKIVTDFGSEFFYSYFKKFSLFCDYFFKKDPFVFWRYDYIIIIPQLHDEENIKASAEELFAQSGQFWYEKDITPFVNVSVLAFSGLNVNSAISIIDGVYAKNLTPSQSSKVCMSLSSTSVSVANGQMAMYHIQSSADKGYPIKLLNIYKGLSIVSGGKILRVVDGDIYVQTEKIQKYLMYTEKSVVLQSEFMPKEIFAEVKHVDTVEPYAILKNPIFLEFSSNNRKSVRVQCDTRIPITVSSPKFTFTGEIFDISMQAIAIRYKNKINGDICGTDVKLGFTLPSPQGQDSVSKVSLQGAVTFVKTFDEYILVVVSISVEPKSEEVVLDYICARQKELIIEIKKLGGMIFK